MRTTIWNLIPGNKTDQETAEQKRQAGLEYIEKLKKEDKVIDVKEENGKFIITLE